MIFNLKNGDLFGISLNYITDKTNRKWKYCILCFLLSIEYYGKYSSSRRRSLGSAVLKKKPNRLVNQLILASQAEIDFNTILIIHSLSKSLL